MRLVDSVQVAFLDTLCKKLLLKIHFVFQSGDFLDYQVLPGSRKWTTAQDGIKVWDIKKLIVQRSKTVHEI